MVRVATARRPGGEDRTPAHARYSGARARAGSAGGLVHAQVSEIQRARIVSATFDVLCQHGAGSVSVAHIVKRSGVSRRTFYEAFTDREDCFLAAFEQALELCSRRVLAAYRAERKWEEQIRAGLVELLVFLEEEPTVGRVLIVESLAGDSRILGERERVLGKLAAAIDRGRGPSTGHDSLPPLTAEGLVGGALAVIHARIARAEREPLVGLTNQLMGMILLPYRGSAAARSELTRSVPSVTVRSEQPLVLLSDPFKDAGMRLTYRTVRALLAVAEHPGASNRQIGEGAGIADQGQMSKLLGRLRRIGLVSNTGLGPGLGAPNSWTLTEKGSQLADSVLAHTANTDHIKERAR
jgi:AcrR family transcriptional regulator